MLWHWNLRPAHLGISSPTYIESRPKAPDSAMARICSPGEWDEAILWTPINKLHSSLHNWLSTPNCHPRSLHMQKLTEFLKPAGSRGVIRCAGDVESGAWKWRTRWVRNGEKNWSLSNHPIPHNGIWIWTWFSCKRNQPTSPSELQMAAAAATI